MAAGFLVWAIAGIRVVSSLVRRGAAPEALIDLGAWLVFIGAFLVHTWPASRRGDRFRAAPLLVQALCAIRLAYSAGGEGMEIALLVMVAGQLPGCVSPRAALAWIFAQTSAVLTAQVLSGPAPSLLWTVMFSGSYLSFQLFALGAASLAESEREAREALAAANLELERMHGLAIETARHAERLRIARDLHDSLGHRLTALGLTLEAARHVPASLVQTKVGEARGLASALIDDLRSSVGDIRDNEAPELRSLLEGLGRSVASPRVVVEVADSLRITSPEATTSLFRMSQEIVTNAARHAGATELRLSLRAVGEEVVLEGVDNGSPGELALPGNGLTGIRERARLLGGDACWSTAGSGGFRVMARVPLARLA
jgi:signal transduction histidine kinase